MIQYISQDSKLSNVRRKAVNEGSSWSPVERLSVQGVQFASLVVMARLLTPTDNDLVGMLAIFITIGLLIADGGFSQAIIRLGKHTEEDVSTAFLFNIGVGGLLYLALICHRSLDCCILRRAETDRLRPCTRS